MAGNATTADRRRTTMRHLALCAGASSALLPLGLGIEHTRAGEPVGAPVTAISASASVAAVSAVDPSEDRPGGDATSTGSVDTANAFSMSSANMGFAGELDFKIGNAMFRKAWVSAPASTTSSDGLGPLYNARACQDCHLKDGRGHMPTANWPDDDATSMFLRLSVPPQTDADRDLLASGKANVIPEPTYGTQLQDMAVPGLAGEGRMHITYEPMRVTLAGGETIELRKPTYTVTDLGYGPLHPGTMLSPRVAQPMLGLGLLEAVPEADILALADPDDRDGDGISGRANRVWSIEQNKIALGRFGWKAGAPTVLQQSAEAAAGDMGLGSALVPRHAGDCTAAQAVCRKAPNGGSKQNPDLEFKTQLLKLTAFYARNLAVPARREADHPDVLAGRQLFRDIGCATCHNPTFTTGTEATDQHLAGQTIWPYTDLLLHDMGDGLADNRPEGRADGREWRTAPLWGIGLTSIVSEHTNLLHDGRARNVTEAILWHGGEAQRARDAFAALPPEDRARLVRFVNSL